MTSSFSPVLMLGASFRSTRQRFVFAVSVIAHVNIVTTCWYDLNIGINSPQIVSLKSIILLQSWTSLRGKWNALWLASLDPSLMLWTEVSIRPLTHLHKTDLEPPETLATGHVAIHSLPKREQVEHHQRGYLFYPRAPRQYETYLNLSELFVQNVCSLPGVRYTVDLLSQGQLNM